MRNYKPQQGAGAAHDGAAGAQQLTGAGAQQVSGAGQHGSHRRRKHFLSIPENRPQRGLLQGSQQGAGSQQTGSVTQHVGAGAQHVGAGAQHDGSGSQQDDLALKQPNRPASADCGATERLRAATANRERILRIEQISGQ